MGAVLGTLQGELRSGRRLVRGRSGTDLAAGETLMNMSRPVSEIAVIT